MTRLAIAGTVVCMSAELDRERKLRLVESAAASAILHGCDPDEVRRRVEVGIQESLASPTYKAIQERERAAAAA